MQEKLENIVFFKLQLCTGPNVQVVHCNNSDNLPQDLYTLTLVLTYSTEGKENFI